MATAKLPTNEKERLDSLVRLGVLDSASEPEFDALVRAASLICEVPVSLISLIDADRQWFKANIGLPGVTETPRELAFCAHAILQDGIFEVPDATQDPRFSDNGLVTGNPDIRFYAGAPLQLSDGTHAGTLCVIDRQPRHLDAKQREMLSCLAAVAVRALEGRRALLAERELRETASQAAAMLRNSLDAVITLALNGTVTHWNAAAEKLFGYTAAQMMGRPLARLLPPDLADEQSDLPAKLAQSAVGFNFESTRLHQSGEAIAVSISVAPIRGAKGELTGATNIIRDIRDQVRAAQVLSTSEARFRALSETSPLGVFSADIHGVCTYTNAQWQAIYGLTPAQSLGDGWMDALHPADRAGVLAEWQRAASLWVDFDMQFRIKHSNGETRHVHTRARLNQSPVDDQGNENSLAIADDFVGSVEDITARLKAERALSDERVRLMSILESTGTGTWEWNVQTGETRYNERWAAIMGLTLEELSPLSIRTWHDRTQPDDLAHASGLMARHLAGELPAYDVETRVMHSDGHWAWVQDRGSVLTWTKNGHPEWMFGTRMDISARKQQDMDLRSSEQLLNRTGEVAGVGGWELNLLTQELRWSAQTRRIHGVAPDYEPDLAHAIHFYTPEAQPLIQAAVERAIETGESWDLELPVIQATGHTIWVRAVGSAEFENGEPVRLVGAVQDITSIRAVTQELASQHELLRVTLESIGDAVITTDASGTVTWMNPVAEHMTGWLNLQAQGHPVSQVFHIVHEDTRAPSENPVARCLQLGRVTGLADNTLLVSRNGEEFGIQDSASPIRSERGDVLGAVLVFHDVTEQRRLSGEMNYRATHDTLTGLINRAEFESRLRATWQKAHEDCSEHALLFIDLDQFKLVNDACGHSVGDQLLQKVSKLLTEAVRARDTLARLGGDEFAVILEHCSPEQALRVAQKICDRMDDFRFLHEERRFRIGTSIGLVPIDNRWGNTAAIVQAADTACVAAKEAGRNRVHTWFDTDQAMRTRHGEMQWASRIEQALDENRFALYAQRIEALDEQGHGLHAEVLLRMIDSDGSVVPPGAFLPAAERFHFASRIDRWVLRRSIDTLRALDNLSAVETLCINLSGQSIGDRAFHRQAMETLTAAGTNICHRICLEITETAAVTNMADASVFIDQARALGVRIALDDFGAGASSFGYLKNLNVDMIKIDGQFIRDVLDDPLDDAAVRCFVDVARVVGVKTVAEFVHRADVLARVREIGIDFAQGYFLHRPEPIQAVLGLATVAH